MRKRYASFQGAVSVESVGREEEDPAESRIEGQVAGMDGCAVLPGVTRHVVEDVGHQVDDGVEVASFGGEADGKVARNRAALAQLLQIQVAGVDFVQGAVGVVEVTPDFVSETLRVGCGAEVEVVAVLAGSDDVDLAVESGPVALTPAPLAKTA